MAANKHALFVEAAWSSAAHQRVSALAQAKQLVVFPARHTKLIALDILTGQEQWRSNVRNVWGQLVLSETTAYYLNQHDQLDAFDLDTGALKWSTKLPGIQGWVHADQTSVIVGAWRNYTPLICLDAETGAVRWTHPIGPVSVQRTAIDAPLQAAVLVQGNSVKWYSLHDGHERHALTLEGSPLQPQDSIPQGVFGQGGRGLLLRAGDQDFYRLTGRPVQVERRHTGQSILTGFLEERDGQIFFLNRQRELCVYSLSDDYTLVLGRVDHQRIDQLPARRLPDGSYLLGTSAGTLWHFGPEGGLISRRRVCKRITTDLMISEQIVAFGTASGTVLGFRI